MNIWLLSAIAMILLVVPGGFVLLGGALMDRVVALQFVSGVGTLTLVLVAVGLGRPSFLDIALALALLGYPASLFAAQFLERWL